MEEKEKKKRLYLEEETAARFERDKEQDTYTLRFQASKLRLTDEEELGVYKDYDPRITREWSRVEHELCMTVRPQKGMKPYGAMRTETDYNKLLIAHSIIQAVMQHTSPRLHLIICPENLLIDDGLHISFIHYGVEESLPPYKKQTDEKLLGELRATLLVILDGAHRFEEYLNYTGTINLSEKAKKFMEQTTAEEYLELVQGWIKKHKSAEKELQRVPIKKWKAQKWSLWSGGVVLGLALVYVVYSLAFVNPRQEAFIESGAAFVEDNYSKVIDTLEPYSVNQMPGPVKYQLAQSYVAVEMLKDDQRENLRNVLVTRAPEETFDYWIAIGRGQNEEAIDLARSLSMQEWIAYANIKWREQIRNDKSLSGKEREEKIKEIDAEIAEYQKVRDEMAEEEKSIPASVEEAPAVEEEPEVEEEAPDGEEKEDKKKDKKDDGDES
ncbi:type VII secretion protein EssB [Bacillus sp. FSL W7-1360]